MARRTGKTPDGTFVFLRKRLFPKERKGGDIMENTLFFLVGRSLSTQKENPNQVTRFLKGGRRRPLYNGKE